MDDWLKDALSGPEGFERQFIDYIGQKAYNEMRGTVLEALRRDEFDCFVGYCKKVADKHESQDSDR